MKFFFIETYGCQMNKADSDYIINDLINAGFVQTGAGKDMAVFFLNGYRAGVFRADVQKGGNSSDVLQNVLYKCFSTRFLLHFESRPEMVMGMR